MREAGGCRSEEQRGEGRAASPQSRHSSQTQIVKVNVAGAICRVSKSNQRLASQTIFSFNTTYLLSSLSTTLPSYSVPEEYPVSLIHKLLLEVCYSSMELRIPSGLAQFSAFAVWKGCRGQA